MKSDNKSVIRSAAAFVGKTLVGRIITCGVVAAALFAVFMYVEPDRWKGFAEWFGGRPLEIDRTANVVEHIRKISELTTACYYEEYVIQDKKQPDSDIGIMQKVMPSPEIVLMAKGKVRAGFDLGKISADDIRFRGDTLCVTLPHPEIFDVIVNPSDYEIFVEYGNWSHAEITELQIDGRARILANALSENILQKADAVGRERIADLFRTLGFDAVRISVAEAPADDADTGK